MEYIDNLFSFLMPEKPWLGCSDGKTSTWVWAGQARSRRSEPRKADTGRVDLAPQKQGLQGAAVDTRFYWAGAASHLYKKSLEGLSVRAKRPVGKIRVKTCHIPKPYVGSVVRVGIASGFRSVGYSPNRLSLLVAYGLRNAKSDGRMSIPLDFST